MGRGWSWHAGARLVGLQRCKKSEKVLGTRTYICVCLTPRRSTLSGSLRHGSWRKRRNYISWSITQGPQVEQPSLSLSISHLFHFYVHTNLGLFMPTGLPSKITADGLEITFATNHVGPFLLTSLLLGQTAFPFSLLMLFLDLKEIVHSKMWICRKFTHPQAIQNVASSEHIWRNLASLAHQWILCSELESEHKNMIKKITAIHK